MPDPPPGEESHGISTDLMVLRRGMPISRFLKKIIFFFKFSVHLVHFETLWPKASRFYGRVKTE